MTHHKQSRIKTDQPWAMMIGLAVIFLSCCTAGMAGGTYFPSVISFVLSVASITLAIGGIFSCLFYYAYHERLFCIFTIPILIALTVCRVLYLIQIQTDGLQIITCIFAHGLLCTYLLYRRQTLSGFIRYEKERCGCGEK